MAGYSRFGFICYHYIVSNLAADFVVTICMVHNSGMRIKRLVLDNKIRYKLEDYKQLNEFYQQKICLLYTSPSPRDTR